MRYLPVVKEVGLLVEKVSNNTTDSQTNNSGQGESCGWRSEGDTSDEDDSLDALSQHGDEGQHEHGILGEESLESPGLVCVDGGLDGLGQLDTPFFLHLADAKQGGTHDGDDDGGEEGECSFVVVLGSSPAVDADGVECADDCCADDEANEEANACA